MTSEKEITDKIKNYAALNQYTILSNTFGMIEYIKFCYKKNKIVSHLKWIKGSNFITITKNNISKKIDIGSLK